eukprot:TRINITY_DN550_c0_g1_i3.p1 TRINITY_DN550_c0_g1~~TRINITY_DN550_c0_g1_i3.p1  ORF type:complete len:346 (-),score=-10.91 TRINITY_DN550_c0_g1_i3:244-1281(-)
MGHIFTQQNSLSQRYGIQPGSFYPPLLYYHKMHFHAHSLDNISFVNIMFCIQNLKQKRLVALWISIFVQELLSIKQVQVLFRQNVVIPSVWATNYRIFLKFCLLYGAQVIQYRSIYKSQSLFEPMLVVCDGRQYLQLGLCSEQIHVYNSYFKIDDFWGAFEIRSPISENMYRCINIGIQLCRYLCNGSQPFANAGLCSTPIIPYYIQHQILTYGANNNQTCWYLLEFSNKVNEQYLKRYLAFVFKAQKFKSIQNESHFQKCSQIYVRQIMHMQRMFRMGSQSVLLKFIWCQILLGRLNYPYEFVDSLLQDCYQYFYMYCVQLVSDTYFDDEMNAFMIGIVLQDVY